MMSMLLGFAKREITPPLGLELAGYAGSRPCEGVHDPLHVKAVVLEQDGARYALLAFDLMCVDESLYLRLSQQLAPLGVAGDRLVACAIHSHAAPHGIIAGEGPLAQVNGPVTDEDAAYTAYLCTVVTAAADACAQAIAQLEPFEARCAQGAIPPVGSERHTGEAVPGVMTAIQCRTQSGRDLIVYNFPCHPTVLSAANLQVSADFTAGIEAQLGADMSVFLNGAAGDVSTRFTRNASSFEECDRFAGIAADAVLDLLDGAAYAPPPPLRWLQSRVTVSARQVETVEEAERMLAEKTAAWKQAEADGADAKTLRILKSYAEGAWLNAGFARRMQGVTEFRLPVTVFACGSLRGATLPGEIFSALLPAEPLMAVTYANGYYRYIAGTPAYDNGYYEAMGAILARGEGEKLLTQTLSLLNSI